MQFHYTGQTRQPQAVTVQTPQGVANYLLGYDQVGSLKAVAAMDGENEGRVVKLVDYDAFGNILADSNPGLFMPLSFAGGLCDRFTGLIRFCHRDYDPMVGRFTAPDPLGDTGGDHDLYDYCVDEPVGRIDPEGLKTSIVIWHPQGFSTSSFGHVSTTIDDSSYSWEGMGMQVDATDKYYEKNKGRYGTELHLDLDRYEEEKLREHLVNYEKEAGRYNALDNNCVDPARTGLEKMGIEVKDDLFPMGFKQNLEKSGVVTGQETLDRNEINVFGSKQGAETAPAAKPNAEDEEE